MRLLDRYAEHHHREPLTEDRPTPWSSRDPEPDGFVPFDLEVDDGR